MSYSNEAKRHIINEARETLSRPLHTAREERREDRQAVDDPPVEPSTMSRNMRHRHEIDEQDQQFARERARREYRLDTPPITVADVEMRIAAALREERQAVIPALRAAVDDLLEQEREHVKSQMTEQMRAFELSVAKLESALSALQVALVAERGKATDLPNPLTRMN